MYCWVWLRFAAALFRRSLVPASRLRLRMAAMYNPALSNGRVASCRASMSSSHEVSVCDLLLLPELMAWFSHPNTAWWDWPSCRKSSIAEGINEAGLSAGLFFFPQYGGYEQYDPAQSDRTLADLQLVAWILTQFSTIDQVKAAIASVRVVGLEPSSVVHWRIGEPSGRQVVLEIVGGVPHFYENEVGVLTNAPGFEWQLTNLNNYVNLYPGDAPARRLSGITLRPIGGNSGFLGLPGDATPPSRFVRAAFYRATAPQRATGFETVQQCFHLLNNFDVPIGIEHPEGECPDIPSATQWTSAIDLTNRRVYYKTAYNNTIRCIDLAQIDFGKSSYQSHPLDRIQEQPVEMVVLPE